MCQSHLLKIENDIPIHYFPTIKDDFLFLSSEINTLFSNMNHNSKNETDAKVTILSIAVFVSLM